MGLSHWTDAAARAAYETTYQATMELWPTAHTSSQVETPFGPTHLVASGERAGDPIVLIHAASLSATQWYRQAADLGAEHRLYAIDIIGDIGLSTQTRRMRTRADAAAWIEGVLDGLGIDRATFVGSSFGGFLSTNFALAHPDRVRALVLLGPAATFKPFRLLANLTIRLGGYLPLPMSVRPALKSMMQGELPDERLVRQMEAGVRGFRYDHGGVYPVEIPDEELAGLASPTMLLVGSDEMIYDASEAIDRARLLVPDISADIVPGLGHLLGLQRPDIVNPRIVEFLAARAPTLQPA
jgi:pimeloyl-ACP methyl ester carboxylesterase